MRLSLPALSSPQMWVVVLNACWIHGCVTLSLKVLDSMKLSGLLPQIAQALRLGPSHGEQRRLRRYDGYKGVGEETFGGREEESLRALGLAPTCSLLLERAGAGAPEFEEWRVDHVRVRLVLVPRCKVPPQTQDAEALDDWLLSECTSEQVVVSAKDSAAALTARAAAVWRHRMPARGAACGLPRVVLVLKGRRTQGSGGLGELVQASRVLGHDASVSGEMTGEGLQHGDVVLVEEVEGGGDARAQAAGADGEAGSRLLALLLQLDHLVCPLFLS